MKLLNFCIGQIQTVQIGNEPVLTAHIKAPVVEPWLITDGGAEGDERAIHPDKIYAYSREGYDYWGNYLGVTPTRWPDGFFGENITLDKLDENELRVGDVFELGDEVRLVVAGARTPCAKLAWRLAQPRSFQKVFALSQRTGVYFGVLASGRVRPGDVARRVQHDETMPSVADVARFCAGHMTPPLEQLRRLLDCPHLSLTNRYLLVSKLEAAERAQAEAAGHWPGWRTFRIERIVEEAPEIKSFYLKPVDGKSLAIPRAGQFVKVKINPAEGEPITRMWSVSAYAHDMDAYRLTIRRQEGRGSRWMHDTGVGATVKLRPPAGNFVLDTGGFRPVILIAAGIGITPLIAMLQAHLARGPIAAPVFLVYGARTPTEQAFSREIAAIAAANPTVQVTNIYSRANDGANASGRITSQFLMKVFADVHVKLGETKISLPWFETDTYICGPGDFCHSIKDELVKLGANPDRTFIELFAHADLADDGNDIEAAEIRFVRSGISCHWNAEDGLSLLELAEQNGVAIASECRSGSCQTCKSRIVAGEVTASAGDGTALLCIGRPKTAMVSIEA